MLSDLAAPASTPAKPPDTAKKLIALTFDDGPRPWVLKGNSQPGFASPSLLDLLDREGVKATFFVMAWRLAPAADRECRKIDAGITCRQAAEEEHRRGHEIENHTYGHGDFRRMNKRYGEEWILNDIDRASRTIEPITGVRPKYLRPPDWDIWPELAQRIEGRGYHVMTKSTSVPPVLRDVDSEDYFCYGKNQSKCPQPSLYDYVLRNIEQRERKGVDGQILVFHELPNSVEVLSKLIPELKKRGYTFVTLQKYMEAVAN
ncbi:MAG TPA: polysaccharide deacetylase family protein [Terriglobia bacterium]|nr:polysaccharide deacetylase family protein [Terriglobia bacterium]